MSIISLRPCVAETRAEVFGCGEMGDDFFFVFFFCF